MKLAYQLDAKQVEALKKALGEQSAAEAISRAIADALKQASVSRKPAAA